MSINLRCKEVNLPQFPTYITYLCYYADLEKRHVGRWQDIKAKVILYLQEIGNQTQDWDDIDNLIHCLKTADYLTFSIR